MLWRHRDFLKLWAGQTVSEFGTLVGRFALPLVAVITLEVSPFEAALLRVADMVPVILVGLVAGVWVDRLRRRPIMVWSDVGRALLLLTIPLAALAGVLSLWQLAAVALLTGVLGTFFEVAYPSYLPTLLERDQLVEGNSKLRASNAVVEVAGFGLGGFLVAALSAPLAVLIDACSFVVSAISLLLIRAPEPPPPPPDERTSALREALEGLGVVWRDRVLRACAGAMVTDQVFIHMFVAMLTLYQIRVLELSPLWIGIFYGVGGVSSFLGAMLTGPITRRFGVGRTIVLAFGVYRLGSLLFPLAGGPFWVVALCLAVPQMMDGAYLIAEINQQSLIQATTPDRLLGRVNATFRFMQWTAMLVGTLVGGVLGEVIGIRATVALGVVGAVPSVLWLIFSPLRTTAHRMPAAA